MSSDGQLPLFPDLPKMNSRRLAIKLRSLKRHLWSEDKANLIAKYLYYFVLVTKNGTYVDGFAGPQNPGKSDQWSVRCVLDAQPQKFGLSKYFLFDTSKEKFSHLQTLVDERPPRQKGERRIDISIEQIDFNIGVRKILDPKKIKPSSPTFCLLDQHSFECHWSTVEALAAYKPEPKVEIFYFLATGWMNRAIKGTKDTSRLDLWWGGKNWDKLRPLDGYRKAEVFSEKFYELGYRSVKPWPIFERGGGKGRVMYFMIHATDHAAAPKLMWRAYNKVLDIEPPQEQLTFELAQLFKL